MTYCHQIIVSWVLVVGGVFIWLWIEPIHFFGSLMAISAMFFRDLNREGAYWKEIGTNPSYLIKGSFTWMLCWLVYILFRYFTAEPIGSLALSNIQFALFIVPFLFTVVFYEVKWFLQCRNQAVT